MREQQRVTHCACCQRSAVLELGNVRALHCPDCAATIHKIVEKKFIKWAASLSEQEFFDRFGAYSKE